MEIFIVAIVVKLVLFCLMFMTAAIQIATIVMLVDIRRNR